MGNLGFGQIIRKLPKNKGKVLFHETYFEESNINQKTHIWSQDMIMTKFVQKKWVSFALGQVYENGRKIKEKCYFMKLTLKRVISARNLLFGLEIR